MSNKTLINFHGSIINAGDYLIQDSAKMVLDSVFPEVKIAEMSRHVKHNIEGEASGVYFGGPFIRKDIFPDVIPMQYILAVPVGVGVLDEHSAMSKQSSNYFERISALYPTSRDLKARDMLLELGCKNAVLGGCPAFLAGVYREKANVKNIEKIVISDPSWGTNYIQAFKLAKLMRSNFKKAEIVFCFHRTIYNTQYKSFKASAAAVLLERMLLTLNIKSVDISGSSTGFSVYDDALHVGFRVHAHVYARSIGAPSVLLTEDLRSVGMNEFFADPTEPASNFDAKSVAQLVKNEIESNRDYSSLQTELLEVTTEALRNNYNAL